MMMDASMQLVCHEKMQFLTHDVRLAVIYRASTHSILLPKKSINFLNLIFPYRSLFLSSLMYQRCWKRMHASELEAEDEGKKKKKLFGILLKDGKLLSSRTIFFVREENKILFCRRLRVFLRLFTSVVNGKKVKIHRKTHTSQDNSWFTRNILYRCYIGGMILNILWFRWFINLRIFSK